MRFPRHSLRQFSITLLLAICGQASAAGYLAKAGPSSIRFQTLHLPLAARFVLPPLDPAPVLATPAPVPPPQTNAPPSMAPAKPAVAPKPVVESPAPVAPPVAPAVQPPPPEEPSVPPLDLGLTDASDDSIQHHQQLMRFFRKSAGPGKTGTGVAGTVNVVPTSPAGTKSSTATYRSE